MLWYLSLWNRFLFFLGGGLTSPLTNSFTFPKLISLLTINPGLITTLFEVLIMSLSLLFCLYFNPFVVFSSTLLYLILVRKGWTLSSLVYIMLKKCYSLLFGCLYQKGNLLLWIERKILEWIWGLIEVQWSLKDQAKQSWGKQQSTRPCCRSTQPCCRPRSHA